LIYHEIIYDTVMKSSGVGGGGTGGASRTVARKWSIGGLYVRAGGA